MATRPSTADGFVMIALELDAVLEHYDLPKYERIVLKWAIWQCYGPLKRKAAWISLADIEHHARISSKNIRRALKALLKKNILNEGRNRSYTVNKHYATWQPAPSEDAADFGESVVGLFGTRKAGHASASLGVQRDSEQGGAKESGERARNGRQRSLPRLHS